jgi:hypothetical protein
LPASAADRGQSACSGLRSFVADQEAISGSTNASHRLQQPPALLIGLAELLL